MSAEMIVDAVQRQFETAGNVLNAWKPVDGEAAESAAFAEDAILVFLERPATVRMAVGRVWEAQRVGRIANPFGIWQLVSILFDKALRQASALQETIATAQTAGFAVARAPEFARAVRELEAMRDEFQTTFPVATPQEAEEDRRSIASGEHLDVEEAFAQIAGLDVETWQQRVG